MIGRAGSSQPSARRSVLFIQATEAAAYPPIINAATLLAERGWQVTVFTAPVAERPFAFPVHACINVKRFRERPSHAMSKTTYLQYCIEAAWLAFRLQPNVIYASDPLGAGPGLLAAKILGARLVYHEHDSPELSRLQRLVRAARSKIAKTADLCVLPQALRLRSFLAETGRRGPSLCVWNCPRTNEVSSQRSAPSRDEPMSFYYHGSINAERLPLTVVEALARASATATLTIVGYEAPGSVGYMAAMLKQADALGLSQRVRYLGTRSRADLLPVAARARVGLVFMPRSSKDINMEYMTGASNKAFDFLAVGQMLLVSNLTAWKDLFVAPGYAIACEVEDVEDLARGMRWCADNPEDVAAMGELGRRRVAEDWNYERCFDGVLQLLGEESR
jgi:glycosyltransferase involved in cell wall biosynthesis